jgi:valyl-tRNA synthetase
VTHQLDSRYDPTDLEARLYQRWVSEGYFHVDAREAEDPYVIVIPPPNVTAALHMGHGLNNTIQDVLIRARRMQGRDALWVPGTDHAGIATQNVVERQLAEEGLTRWDLGREAFVERVWEWVEEYGSRIIEQLKAIGCSCDWERTRFTLDEGLSRAVREVFVRLYEKGLVYRGQYIINWCPRCGTALSNEEAEHREQPGELWHIAYPLEDEPSRRVIVATTRPETMLGDTGLAVHPGDERYADLVGRVAVLPLVGRRLPIVADEYVDPEFGSGVVKVTPAHDPNDFEIGRRHDLEVVDVMTDEATMSAAAPEPFRGLDRFEARKAVVAALEEQGLLVRAEDHQHSVGRCYRCDTIVEPRLSLQWFVKMEPLARPALAAYRSGRLRFHPERYGHIYEHWMENIRDWCISRQLWWGHRIPVWYCQNEACRSEVVAREDPDACPECGGALERDPDVLDTWFSSWLWPFSTLGWPERTADLETFYPTDTLVTASDILFFWVARMVMAGLEFCEELPFTDVVINGTVRDHLGRRMSKSLGNGIDPLEVVDRFGADALRFTLLQGAALGTDLQLDYRDLDASFQVGRNFANKIWNAVRFALPHLDEPDGSNMPGSDLELTDRWVLSRARAAALGTEEALDAFRLHQVASRVYHFVWDEFCDWYLELAKPRLGGERGEESRRAAAWTLRQVLETWLRLLHPVMPFITEEQFGMLPGIGRHDTLTMGPWPETPADWQDDGAERALDDLRELISTIRNLRSEYGIQPQRELEVRLDAVSSDLEVALEAEEDGLRRLARVASVQRGAGGEGEAGAFAVLRAGTELFVPLADVVDLARERERVEEELGRVDGLLESARRRLANRAFLEKAPAEVVEREREKADSLEEQRSRLREKRRILSGSGGSS